MNERRSSGPVARRLRQGAWVALLGLALLAGCGGGGDPQADSLATPTTEELGGSPCPGCREGILSGVVIDGTPMVGAEIRVIDLTGASRTGTTDALGRFDIDVRGLALSASLLVQASGPAQGQPVRWHAPMRGTEVGKRALVVSPLSELLTALAMGGVPDALLADGRADLMRLDAAAIRASEGRVETALRPLLDAAGVPQAIDMRLSALAADGASGLALALSWLEVQALGTAYRVRHAADAPDAGWHLDPAAGGVDTGLPALAPGALARLQAARAAQLGLQSLLLQLEAALAAPGGPEAAPLRPLLAAAFRHQGLDGEGYIDRVLRRSEAAQAGGRTLAGAQVGAPRVLEMTADGKARLRFALTPAAPHEAVAESLWAAPIGPGGGWLLLGDGQAAAARVRPASVLGPRPVSEAEMRARQGVDCVAWQTLGCVIPGGMADVPGGGQLLLGAPGEAQFGVLGLFVSNASDAVQRWEQTRAATRLLAAPSTEVGDYLLFEVDAWRIDPRAARALVIGPGLPPQGLALVPPPVDLSGAARHWVLESAPKEDWAGVERGWCTWVDTPQAHRDCTAAWSALMPGPARWRLQLLDTQGRLLHEQPLALEGGHGQRSPGDSRQALFPRFDLAALPDSRPTWANVLAWGHDGAALALSWPWRPGAGTQMLQVELEWHRAPFPDATIAPAEMVQLRRPLQAAQAAHPLSLALAARPGWRTTWLVARLQASDPLGHRYLHFVAPSNPH